jgi:hypothetical protein
MFSIISIKSIKFAIYPNYNLLSSIYRKYVILTLYYIVFNALIFYITVISSQIILKLFVMAKVKHSCFVKRVLENDIRDFTKESKIFSFFV